MTTSDVEVVDKSERRPPWAKERPQDCDHGKAYMNVGPTGEVIYVCVDCGMHALSPREFEEVRDE